MKFSGEGGKNIAHQLRFDQLITYDPGAPGISLEITLKLGSESISIQAKVDTGSGGSIFSRRFGEHLGLTIENGQRQFFSTATGTFATFGHFVTMEVAGIEFEALVYFAADEYFERNVIGRFGGLDHLVVGIMDYEGKLYLSRYGDE